MTRSVATHASPVWRDRSNWIVVVDLTAHRMPGAAEQLWARTDDQREFELCCIPFFTYGLALGDLFTWDFEQETIELVRASGRRALRVAFTDETDAAAAHEGLHGELLGLGCLVEFRNDGYGAVDIESDAQQDQVVELLAPWVESGRVFWEWAHR